MIFHLLRHGQPMTYFKGCKELFDFNLLNNRWKHWTNTIDWNMAEAMHKFVFWALV